MNRLSSLAALQLPLRAAAAAGLPVTVAQLLQLPHPLYAMIAAVLVTDLSPAKTRKLGIPRLAGTVLGATLDATIGSLLPGGTWFLGLGIFGGMYLTHVMGLEEAVKLAGYVCGIVLLDHASKPWSCAVWRIVETLLGIGLAVSVSFVPKLLSPDTSEQSCA